MLDGLRDVAIPVILFSIILALGSCREAHELMPNIVPEAKQLLLQAGDPIYFLCEGTSKIYFFYPNHPESQNDKVISSPLEIKESQTNGLYTYNFTRANSLPGDTGWYGCAYHNVTITPEMKYDDPDVNWFYIYVLSSETLFVEEKELGVVNAMVGGKAILPCRPTDPSINVTLWNLESNEEVVLGKKVTYDPRFGFEITHLTEDDSGLFECSTWGRGLKQVVQYHLQVLPNISLDNPIIDMKTLRYVIRGQTLHVNCTITSVPKSFVLNWTTPHQNNRISTFVSYFMRNSSLGAFNVLTIENVTYEDQGEYECFVSDSTQMKSAKMYLKLHDPEKTYINLTSQYPNMRYVQRFGGKIKWVVYVSADPEPDLRWFDPNGKEIISGWPDPAKPKYVITRNSKCIMLTIFRLDIADMGNYTLRAVNENKLQILNFTLNVLTKPVPIIKNIESYYAPNQTATFQCDARGFPLPGITWSFLRYQDYPFVDIYNELQVTDTHEEKTMNSVVSKARMTINDSGNINCTACNFVGCKSSYKKIFISDIGGGFHVMELRKPITEGNNINIVCAASIYTYTEHLVWRKRGANGKEIDIVTNENERIKIVKEKTPFTYRTILKINEVRKGDSNFYSCSATTKNGNKETIKYELNVYDADPRTFMYTNMNGTTLNIDLATEGNKTIFLKCFGLGTPLPNITWYKDDVMLKETKQYKFVHNNNELRIMYLLERDGGKYSCHATYYMNTIKAFVNILVKEKRENSKIGKETFKGLIAIIACLTIMALILVMYFTIKVRRKKILRKELLQIGLMHFEKGALERLNPDLTVDDQAELLPYDKKWEFPRERLKLGRQLGSGAFGVVMKAEAQGICDDEAVTTVAVKMVRRTTEPTYVRALASELKIMVHLGKHLNVVNLLGACTKNIAKRKLLVIVEYCRFGNLHNFLLRHRSNFINQIHPATGKLDPMIGINLLARISNVSSPISISAISETETNDSLDDIMDTNNMSMSSEDGVPNNNSSQPGWRSNYRGDYKDHNLKPICTQDLLSWAFQVARGMEYLSQRKVLHGDLAARNILLAEDNVVKICDFGLAKTMYKDDNYKKKGDGPLPIKWMAIESLRDGIFSTQSDVWSFGIVLWEFFTLAETPYPGMETEKQFQKLIEGYRMDRPAYATAKVYNIMLECWTTNPTLRPSFTELVNSIGDLLVENVKAHYISLNAPYVDMNTSILDQKNDCLTMMSAPDHKLLSMSTHMNSTTSAIISENASDPAQSCINPSNPKNEPEIFSPMPNPEKSCFEFPSVTSDSEDAVEASPMLQSTENHNQKPINVHERRAEFSRQRQVSRNQVNDHATDKNSGYYKTPRNLSLMDMNDQQNDQVTVSKQRDKPAAIDITQDNYVNVLNRRSDLKRDVPDGFSNPNYVVMSNNDVNQTKV